MKKKKNVEYYMSLPYRLEIYPDAVEGGFTAAYPDLPGCLTCAETMEDLIKNAIDAKREWITASLEDGDEIAEPESVTDLSDYSGQFKIRMPKTLHRSLVINAKKEGISMNQYCIYLLSKNNPTNYAY